MEKVISKKAKYSEEDYECLFSLIEKHGPSIKIAGNTAKQIYEKNKEWELVIAGFNEITGHNAGEKQLRKLWDNLKQRSKQSLATEKKERARTGGGRFAGEASELDQKVATLMGDEFKPYENLHDSDAKHHGDDVIDLAGEEIKSGTPKLEKSDSWIKRRTVKKNAGDQLNIVYCHRN